MSMDSEFKLKSNFEYIQEFCYKHNFDTNIHIQCHRVASFDNVDTVVFNEKDIPDGTKVSIHDIMFDIDSDVPEDMFIQWLKYCKEVGEIKYMDWIFKKDTHYVPKEFDKFGTTEFVNSIVEMVKDLEDMINDKFDIEPVGTKEDNNTNDTNDINKS